MSEAVIVAILGIVGVIFGGVISGAWLKRKNTADADKTVSETNEQIRETVMALIEPLMKRVTELELQVCELKEENEDLQTWAKALVKQVLEAGLEPVKFIKRRQS